VPSKIFTYSSCLLYDYNGISVMVRVRLADRGPAGPRTMTAIIRETGFRPC
jgi:hypothetical protein